MQKQKKHWTRPQLVVLLRGTPQEDVLKGCKTIGGGGGGDRPITAYQNGCNALTESNCGVCQSRGGS